MDLAIDRHEGQRACVFHLAGDIDVAVVPDLRGSLDQVIETGCENIVLDLTEVTYADSSALGLLVWLDHRLQPREGKAILAGANDDVARIFELSGLLSVAGCLEEREDVESAVACFDPVGTGTEAEWSQMLEMPADVQALAGVREQVHDLVGTLDFGESALFDIKVAVGEALANAVRHGSPTDGQAAIHIAVTAYPDRVVLQVTDSGSGFDGDHVCSDDLYAVGGRGVMFMRALMDQVCFAPREGGGTEVTLVKHRPLRLAE
ncbi:MAG: anti-sigma factor antagonist [Anaerosomatales bacterium]|nr:anti-sigma factor antagonist [Anaerosomatales bacterium]MDT8434559.1 anti-sigma factor antagonist [Anaerosomatales bacterium]